MFIADKFIYIQMQKTGCTHIAKLMSQMFDGKQVGTHNPASIEQINSGKIFISSIRNPWDWYLSLWTYGVQGNGGVMKRLTRGNRVKKLSEKIIEDKSDNRSLHLLEKIRKKTSIWRKLYADNENVNLFREWLKLVLNPESAELLREGYAQSQLPAYCGFMSFRYIKLCCLSAKGLGKINSITNFKELQNYEYNNCYIDFFIRQEFLERDLFKAVEKIRPMSEEEKCRILQEKKTNTSIRPFLISQYYDSESIDLVYEREKLLINKFKYDFPD